MTLAFNINFSASNEHFLWRVSNDTVMGGISQSTVTVKEGALHFNGNLSLENNGGFTSVWREPEFPFLESSTPLIIVSKGDGRLYQVRIRTKLAPNISYFATFKSAQNNFSQHSFSESEFIATWRGRQVIDAPPLRFEDASQIGFLLADKLPGDFHLTIAEIKQLNVP